MRTLDTEKVMLCFWSMNDFAKFLIANEENFEFFFILHGGSIKVDGIKLGDLNELGLISDIFNENNERMRLDI